MAEMLNMAMMHVVGCDTTIALAAQAGQLEMNVMMPVIAHNLFEMMHVTIGALKAFTEKCVRGIAANRDKAQGWLEGNAIIVTALNPLIGYSAGASLVEQAEADGKTIRAVAVQKAAAGELRHRSEDRVVSPEEIEEALGDLRRLTDAGLRD
jgi:fumarate hydratase class II